MKSPLAISVFAVLMACLMTSHVSAQRPFERLQRGWDDIRPRGQLLRDIFGTDDDRARQQAAAEQQRRAAQQRQAQQRQAQQRQAQQRQTQYRRGTTPQQQGRLGSALQPQSPARNQNRSAAPATHPTRLEIAVKQSNTPPGLQVDQISNHGAAWAAGIRRGDIIVTVGGIETTNKEDLQSITQVLKAGDQIEFEVMRRGKKEQMVVQFGSHPDEVAEAQGTAPASRTDGPASGRVGDVMVDRPRSPRQGSSRRQPSAGGMHSVLDNGLTRTPGAGTNASWQVQPPGSRNPQATLPKSGSTAPRTVPAATPLTSEEIRRLQRQIGEQQRQIEILRRQLGDSHVIPAVPKKLVEDESLLDFPK